MPPLSAIDTHVAVAHVDVAYVIVAHVVAHVVVCRCRRRHRPPSRPQFRSYRCRFLVDCCMWNPPHPLHHSSCRSMTSSYHRGCRRRTMPTPADPMRGGHRVIVVLPHRRPSPLAVTACSLRRRSRRCHLHLSWCQQNDRRRWR